ncbi:triose-phosphate isomerase [Pseudenhygromyxa sp. WMMC2535]|uniref:triose-phosphate isomerase n=1 Tax=Pseudenhygromyxa sp. WMMC2535 TaxID=2712867 RepID=UPI00155190D4|nr:triose-phosphate isomerase [Pseudenhygromyxa sp. WMMC2535]NVB41851.1 triose-phosphate isomerase [Pseudenhygromyxa sp. WMMC2535]
MARTTWVLGNWKQNLLREPARNLAAAIAEGLSAARGEVQDERLRVGVAPTFLTLDTVAPYTGEAAIQLRLLAQDVAAQESGAFTGEVGPAMLREAGVRAAIIGHSERRAHFGDHDTLVAAKVHAALAGDLDVVLCVGETLAQRDEGEHEAVVISQLSAALGGIQDPAMRARVVVAYEPIWAIGTGRTATPEQASAMHGVIRSWLASAGLGADRSVLYGGSVKPNNAADLLAAGDIDGFLVGGASLDARSLLDIVSAAAAHAAANSGS